MKKGIVRQVGYLRRLYRDAGQQNIKFNRLTVFQY
jgi:hypothetical protein